MQLFLSVDSNFLTRAQIGPLAEDRWFVADILGIDVYTDDDQHLSTVGEVMQVIPKDVTHDKGMF